MAPMLPGNELLSATSTGNDDAAIRQIRAAVDNCHIAALPVTFRTTEEHPTFFNLPDDDPHCACHSPHGRPFPTALDPLYVNRYEIREFAEEAWKLGSVQSDLGARAANDKHNAGRHPAN